MHIRLRSTTRMFNGRAYMKLFTKIRNELEKERDKSIIEMISLPIVNVHGRRCCYRNGSLENNRDDKIQT